MVNPLKYVALAVTHPHELRAVCLYKIWRDEKVLATDKDSGWERPEMRRCYELLDMTSRSFAAVIKELNGDLCRAICLFYLVLRGLDTVEDDMTLDTELKAELLENFHKKLSQPGWTFTQSGPNEKDRQLLVEFDKVISELMRLDEHYRSVITRICAAMGSGMAHYARVAATSTSTYAVDTLADHDMYCHYVAGLVGEGLSALFSASGKEIPELGRMLTLSNSMGLMLQKTNITRDFREDLDDGRFFWPREIWGKYTSDPKEFFQDPVSPEMQKKALWALSEMVTDALVHSVDCLDYISLLKDQSVFNFCAIPQVMAIATLEVCFMNPNVFRRNVKIRKSLALYLIQKSTNPRDVGIIFLEYARKIHKRAVPEDPNFIKICIVLGQIEQWLENRYPSWLFSGSKLGSVPQYRDEPAAQAITDARVRQLPAKTVARRAPIPGAEPEAGMTKSDIAIILAFVFGLVLIVLLMTGAAMGIIWYYTAENPGATVRQFWSRFLGNGTAKVEL